jgi:hypothetical protein
MFCAPGLVFGGIEGVVTRFHALRAQTHFRRYRGRRLPFSSFARTDSFSAVPRASAPVFMFCAPGHDFDGTEGVSYRFLDLRAGIVFVGTEGVVTRLHVLRARTHFGGTEGVGSRLQVLRAPTHFRGY